MYPFDKKSNINFLYDIFGLIIKTEDDINSKVSLKPLDLVIFNLANHSIKESRTCDNIDNIMTFAEKNETNTVNLSFSKDYFLIANVFIFIIAITNNHIEFCYKIL